MKAKCPGCRKLVEFSKENPYRPFCSERCQILDLGQWADEKYAIPTEDSELSSVNENQNDLDQNDEHSLNPPPKHQLN